MNKTEMAEKLAKKCDISQSKALECVNVIFETKAGKGIIAVERMPAARCRSLVSEHLTPSVVPPARAATPRPVRRSLSPRRSTRHLRPPRVSRIALLTERA